MRNLNLCFFLISMIDSNFVVKKKSAYKQETSLMKWLNQSLYKPRVLSSILCFEQAYESAAEIREWQSSLSVHP